MNHTSKSLPSAAGWIAEIILVVCSDKWFRHSSGADQTVPVLHKKCRLFGKHCLFLWIWPTMPNAISWRTGLALTVSIKSFQPAVFPFCKYSTVCSLFPLLIKIFLFTSSVKCQSITMLLQVQINSYSSSHRPNAWLLQALITWNPAAVIWCLMELALPGESQSCHLFR